MNKISLFFIFLILTTNLTLALEPDSFNLTISPHYYSDNYRIKVYMPNQTYDGVSFEIIGINNKNYRILNISVLDTYPKNFTKYLDLDFNELRIRQKKSLGTTDIIFVNEFNGSNFSVTLMGIKEGTNIPIIAYAQINFKDIPERSLKDEVISKIGDLIWEGEPTKGLWIGLGIIGIMIFIMWKYKLFGNISNSMEKYRNREKYKRLYGGRK